MHSECNLCKGVDARSPDNYFASLFHARRAAALTSRSMYAGGVCYLSPLFSGQEEAVVPSLVFNSLEFEGIESRVVKLLPNTQEQHGVLVLDRNALHLAGKFGLKSF